MATIKKIEARTLNFIKEYERLTTENKMISNVKLAGILGVKSKSTISEILAKRQNIQPEAWDRFVKHFALPYEEEGSDFSELRELATDYVAKRRESKNGPSKENEIPMYFGNTRAGTIEVYSDDPEMNKPVGHLPASIFPGCNHGERVSGDSMYPLICNQAYVIGRVIDKKGIIWGEKYIIHTKYGQAMVKYIHPSEKGSDHIKIVSHSKQVPSQDLPLDEITFVCRVNYIVNPS